MQLVRLAGGRGTSWRCGDLVFKPADLTDAELAWMDTALRPRVVDATIRVSLPLRARSGRRQVAGWIALPYLRGHHRRDAGTRSPPSAVHSASSRPAWTAPRFSTGATIRGHGPTGSPGASSTFPTFRPWWQPCSGCVVR